MMCSFEKKHKYHRLLELKRGTGLLDEIRPFFTGSSDLVSQ